MYIEVKKYFSFSLLLIKNIHLVKKCILLNNFRRGGEFIPAPLSPVPLAANASNTHEKKGSSE